MRVLVIEDEKKTASFIRKALQAEGYAVDVCHDGDEGLVAPSTTPYDAIVLDIMLPGRDGLSILRHWRQIHNRIPVLLLSARGDVIERVEGRSSTGMRSEEHTSELQSQSNLVCRLLLEKKKPGYLTTESERLAVTHRAAESS